MKPRIVVEDVMLETHASVATLAMLYEVTLDQDKAPKKLEMRQL